MNGSANGTYVASKENSNTTNGSFPRGFAPKCRGAQNSAYAWRYVDGNWKCSYPTAGQGEITVNFFQTPPTDGSTHAEFQINWSELKDWSAAYPTQPEGAPIDAEKSAYPVNVTAQCWIGEEDNRPTDLSKVANITRSVQNQKHLQIATELPLRNGVYGNKYACIFSFKQKMRGDYVRHEACCPQDLLRRGNLGYVREYLRDQGKCSFGSRVRLAHRRRPRL